MSRKYTGDLAKPYQPERLGPLASDELKESWRRKVFAEKKQRMGLLFDLYGFEVGDWEGLAWGLATDHVPGMKLGERSGRQKKWDDYTRAMLVLCVEETGLSVTNAAAFLAEQEPWKSFLGPSSGASRLRDEYHRQSDHKVQALVRDACDAQGVTPVEFARKYLAP
ncbi:hypothetical protein [Pseudomonas marincola]|uniref:hypothetical protein n=1 Tax=Pseudomonas marincola TaxID=437900 RepID=UPI00195892F6|nr:hypothetical protein [Pseudomonas marincola]